MEIDVSQWTGHLIFDDVILFWHVFIDDDSPDPLVEWPHLGEIILEEPNKLIRMLQKDKTRMQRKLVPLIESSHGWKPYHGDPIGGVWKASKEALKNIKKLKGAAHYDALVDHARGACDTYNTWAAGDVFGWEYWVYQLMLDPETYEPLTERGDYAGGQLEEDGCIGCYGWDSVESGLKVAIEDVKQKLNASCYT